MYIRIIFLYKESHHTVRNNDLDSGINTKTSNLALKSYLNMLYSGRDGDLFYSAIYFKSVHQ